MNKLDNFATLPIIKTDDAIGPTLDGLVAKAAGLPRPALTGGYDGIGNYHEPFTPSTNWVQAGPILEENNISTIRCDDDYGVDEEGFSTDERIPVWCAITGEHGLHSSTEHQHHEAMFQIYESEVVYGPTPLVAGMRCYLVKKFGPTVEVPSELLT